MSKSPKLKNFITGLFKRTKLEFITDIESAHSRGGVLITSWRNFTLLLFGTWIGWTCLDLVYEGLWSHNWGVVADRSFHQLGPLFVLWLVARRTWRWTTPITVLHGTPTEGGPGEHETEIEIHP